MKTRFLSAWACVLCIIFATAVHAQNKSIAAKDTVVIIKVSGVYCALCPPNICARVKEEKGIKNCVLIGKPSAVSKFKITYNPTAIVYSKVVEAIQNTPSCDNPNEKPFKVKRNK